MTTSHRSLLILFVTVILLAGYNFIGAAWTPAVGLPPSNNTAAPVNVGATTQAKTGNLSANIFAATVEMRSNRYCDALGGNCFTATSTDDGMSCTNIAWNEGLELTAAERPDGNRYMIMPQSVNQRCVQLGYDIGFAVSSFGPQVGTQGWCGFANARTAHWNYDTIYGYSWKSTGCANYAVAEAKCCTI